MRKFIRQSVIYKFCEDGRDYKPLGKAGFDGLFDVNLFYTLEYMNRWSPLITSTLVLCDVATASPTLAKTFSPSMKGNCIDGIKSFITRDQLLPKALKR